MRPSWDHLGAISGPSWAISGYLGRLGAVLGHLRAISRSSHVYLAPFQACDFGRRTVHSRLCKIRISLTRDANFGIYGPDLRLLQSVLASSSGRLEAISGPSWDRLSAILALLILGLLRGTLGRLGPSRGEDRRRHRRFSKIRTSLTREHHFGFVLRLQLGPFWGHLRPSRGHLVHIDHLGVILGLSDVISVLRLLKTDDA